MQRHIQRAVAKGLENRHLVALRADQPLEHHVQQKRRHAQKDQRKHPGHGSQPAKLLVQIAVRELVHAPDGTAAAIARQDAVHGRQRLRLAGARRQLHRDLVEGAFHVHRRTQRAPVRPENGVALVIRKQRPRLDLVQILRRHRNPHHGELLRAPVHRGPQRIARLQPVRLGKGIAHQHLTLRKRRQHAPGAQIQPVLLRLALVWKRQQQRLDRLVEARQGQLAAGNHARFHLVHARQLGHARRHALRRPPHLRPHIGKAVILVQARARVLQRIQRGARHHQHGNA